VPRQPIGRAPQAPALSIPERVLLFCIASDTDWEHAGVTGTTVTAMIVRGLIQRDRRANGVLSLDVSCWNCHHRAIMSAGPWPDDVPVPTFGPRMVCTRCGIIGADARTRPLA
jgi:hypothetical protein